MMVCAWAKAKRSEVIERWIEAGSLCRGFNRRFNGLVAWPDDDIEAGLEDLLSILEPLSNLDRLDEEDSFLSGDTGGISLQMMD